MDDRHSTVLSSTTYSSHTCMRSAFCFRAKSHGDSNRDISKHQLGYEVRTVVFAMKSPSVALVRRWSFHLDSFIERELSNSPRFQHCVDLVLESASRASQARSRCGAKGI